ncbi:MAG: MFS transporter [Acidimicrobiales bacterium]
MAGRTFRSLHVRNYRLYFYGQIVSVSGTWMQSVAQVWLVLRLTGSGVDLGLVTACQFLPMLVLGAWGGVVADRLDKRRLLYGTQTVAGVLALVLGLLVVTGAVKLWMVFMMAVLLGFVNVIDNPARQTFVLEMVGRSDLANAVSLNSVVMNSARVIGPAIAGILIETVGIGVCFLINAASYLAVIAGLALMREDELQRGERVVRAKRQLRDGLSYAWRTRELRDPLLMMVVIGTFAYNFNITLPLMAKYVFASGAGVYGAMSALMGAGAVVGGLATASRAKPTPLALAASALVFGLLMLAVAGAPNLASEFALLLIMGAASIFFISLANSTLQLQAAPEMRGRVMALYAVAFLGSAPVGGPIVGAVAQAFGPRSSLALGGVCTVAAAIASFAGMRRTRIRALSAVVPGVTEAGRTAVGAALATPVESRSVRRPAAPWRPRPSARRFGGRAAG